MRETLPLFPLGTVLYPGVVLPLHIFEERYRQLVRDLLNGPAPHRFGVIAIREGRETGVDGVRALYEVGCTAMVRRIEECENGRFNLVTVGSQRFRLVGLDESRPYLQGEVDVLAEETGGEAAERLAAAVRQAFSAYFDALTSQGMIRGAVTDLPDDPVALSYLVAASMIVDLADKQILLAEPDTSRRLEAERAMLSRETTLLRTLTSRPAPDLRYSPYSQN